MYGFITDLNSACYVCTKHFLVHFMSEMMLKHNVSVLVLVNFVLKHSRLDTSDSCKHVPSNHEILANTAVRPVYGYNKQWKDEKHRGKH